MTSRVQSALIRRRTRVFSTTRKVAIPHTIHPLRHAAAGSSRTRTMDLKQHIRSLPPDFPKPGNPLLRHLNAARPIQGLADNGPTPGEALRGLTSPICWSASNRGAFLLPRRWPMSSGRVCDGDASEAKCPAGRRASPMIWNTGPTTIEIQEMRSPPRSNGRRPR